MKKEMTQSKRPRQVLQCAECGWYLTSQHWARHWKRNHASASGAAHLEMGKEPRQGHYWWVMPKWNREYRTEPAKVVPQRTQITGLIK